MSGLGWLRKPRWRVFNKPAVPAKPIILIDATASDLNSHASLAQMLAAPRITSPQLPF